MRVSGGSTDRAPIKSPIDWCRGFSPLSAMMSDPLIPGAGSYSAGMLIRVSVAEDQPIPPVGTAVPFTIGDCTSLALMVASRPVAGRVVITVSMPDWVADCLSHDGRTIGEPVTPEWHQTRTAHGALAPHALT